MCLFKIDWDDMSVNIILLVIFLIAILWTVMTARLMRAAIGLAVVSVVLSMLMFQLGSPLAAVFELSVCAGLISVIFFITISFTRRLSNDDLKERRKEKFNKFWILPFIVLVVGILLTHYKVGFDFPVPVIEINGDVKSVLWEKRHLDLLGQVIVLLAGAIGVVTLFKGKKNES